VTRDGVFSSRRGTGEGLLPPPSELILPRSIRAATLSPCTFQPNASAKCGATKLAHPSFSMGVSRDAQVVSHFELVATSLPRQMAA
jgi:hypothetical protein